MLLASHACAFPDTNDITRCEFAFGAAPIPYGHEVTNDWMTLDLQEARAFIGMFPLFGNLKPWSVGMPVSPGGHIDPAPLYYHLLLTTKNGKQRSVGFSLHAGIVAYHVYGLKQVPKELQQRAETILEQWHTEVTKVPSQAAQTVDVPAAAPVMQGSVLTEEKVIEIARKAVQSNDAWADRAEFEAKKNAAGMWSVAVWRIEGYDKDGKPQFVPLLLDSRTRP